jgi:hypothetical protein
MKRPINNFIIAFCLLAGATGFFLSCNTADLTKDLTLTVSTDFLVNSFSVQVTDAADSKKIPTDLSVTIEGRDKDKIFSILGEKKITPVQGIIALATKKLDAPTGTKTLDFTIVLKATGYIERRKTYSIAAPETSSDINYDRLTMVNPNALPTGASAATASFNSAANTGTATEIKFSSPLTAGKTEQSEVKVLSGTKMLASDGTELTGAVQSQIIHYSSKNKQSFESLPGGVMASNIKDVNGANLGAAVMMPAGWYSLNMSAGGKTIEKFSKPIEVTTVIDPSIKNPFAGRPIRAGDTLTVMSLANGADTWVREFTTVVQTVGGKLQVTYPQTHLSDWGVFFVTIKTCKGRIRVTSDLPAANGSACSVPVANYYYEIVNAYIPELVFASGYSSFGNNVRLKEIITYDLPLLDVVTVNVYNNDIERRLIGTSGNLNVCATFRTDFTGKLPKPNTIAVKFDIGGVCVSSNNIKTVLVPSATLFYRDMDVIGSEFRPLVYVDKGKGCAEGLTVGRRYDFAIAMSADDTKDLVTMSKELKQPNGLRIPQGDTSIVVNSPVFNFQHTFVVKKINNSQYNLDYPAFSLPKNICDEIDKRFSIFIGK